MCLDMVIWGASNGECSSSTGVLYCITPALDGYVSLLDRTPHTQMMMSLNICSMAFYNLWHLLLFTSIHLFCFCLNCFHLRQPPADKTYPQLVPMKLGYHPQFLQPQPNLWHLPLWSKCGECGGRDRQ